MIGKASARECIWAAFFGRILVGLTAPGALGAEGDLDASYGSSGATTIAIGQVERPLDTEIAPDGKIVVVGTTGTSVSAQDADAFVARLQANGSVDTSFGGGDGEVTLDVGDFGAAHAVAVRPDGTPS